MQKPFALNRQATKNHLSGSRRVLLQPGGIIQSRYQIITLLGQGGMGAVYQARDLHLGQIIALKENSGSDPRQFQQEAVILANLKHPNLPRVTDHFVEPSRTQYLAMDFIAGEDLATGLEKQGAFAEAQALVWINQILDAVEYLHCCGVIHRDIKPANIKVTPQGQAVLVDFGIAKVCQPGQRTGTGARAGTAGYAPPEQYRGGTDQRSDIYALGATLFALLAGGDPPHALALERGTAKLIAPNFLNGSTSARVTRAIIQAMELQPQHRFVSVVEMMAALAAPRTVGPRLPRPQALAWPSFTDPTDGPVRALASAEAYWEHGCAYSEGGDYDRAIADYTKAMQLDPKYRNAYIHRANAYSKKGNPGQAVADYSKAIALDPEYYLPYIYRGLAYANKGNLDLAVADSNKAVELQRHCIKSNFAQTRSGTEPPPGRIAPESSRRKLQIR